ncbi:50S ribosomal protein L32e [Candidatus Pacearchaeota archaeon]|nr:50S ribosomal protein L32e [Candidatus Pacearchaeota archaeon]
MAEKKEATKRSKPKFLRNDWHKKIRLGRTVKKNRKWRGAKGRHNKLRLNRKGHSQRPKIGWGAEVKTKGFVDGIEAVRVETLKALESLKKDVGIIIGSVGKKKKEAIIAKANEKKIKILNKYRKATPLSVPANTGAKK